MHKHQQKQNNVILFMQLLLMNLTTLLIRYEQRQSLQAKHKSVNLLQFWINMKREYPEFSDKVFCVLPFRPLICVSLDFQQRWRLQIECNLMSKTIYVYAYLISHFALTNCTETQAHIEDIKVTLTQVLFDVIGIILAPRSIIASCW